MLLEFFLRAAASACMRFHGGIDFSLTPDSELLGIAAKLVSSFSPRLQLGRRLKLECRRLLLDLFAEAFDVFLDLGLERIPLWLQSCFCGGPCGLVGFGLLLDGVPEDITALAQVSEGFVGLVAGIGLAPRQLCFQATSVRLPFHRVVPWPNLHRSGYYFASALLVSINGLCPSFI